MAIALLLVLMVTATFVAPSNTEPTTPSSLFPTFSAGKFVFMNDPKNELPVRQVWVQAIDNPLVLLCISQTNYYFPFSLSIQKDLFAFSPRESLLQVKFTTSSSLMFFI